MDITFEVTLHYADEIDPGWATPKGDDIEGWVQQGIDEGDFDALDFVAVKQL